MYRSDAVLRALAVLLAAAAGLAPQARAGGFAELPFASAGGAAACLRATGAPGELARWTPDGVALLRAGRDGLSPTGTVALGTLAACPAVAAQSGGAAVLAAATTAGLRVATRGPAGGWSAPVAVPASNPGSVAVAASARGDGLVAWAEYAAGGRGALVAAADAGAPFATPQRLGTASASFSVALAVAPGGRALASYEAQGRLWVAERLPGGAFAPARVLATSDFGRPAVAVRDDGTAVVAWLRSARDAGALLRVGGAPFGEAVTSPSEFSLAEAALYAVRETRVRRGDPPGDDLPSPQVQLGADARALVAWSTQDGPRLASVTSAGRGAVERLASPLRDARAVTPLITAEGARAVAWQDDVAPFGARPSDGRLHLALEGGTPAPSPVGPAVRVLAPSARALRIDAPLALRVHCAAACDVRARVPRRFVDAQASLAAAGTATLRLRPTLFPLAPRRPGRLRIEVLAGAPGAARASTTTAAVRLRRIAPPPFPHLRGLRATRRGADVVVRWRTDVPARLSAFFVGGLRSRHGEGVFAAVAERQGAGQRRFAVTLRGASAVRWVRCDVLRALTRERGSALVRVSGRSRA